MDLILIEGLPGSGKSTLAEKLCDFARSNGIQSSWYLEESHEHPVHPIKFRTEKYKASFPEHCLKQWQTFISNNKEKEQLFILEGSLLQSTVRFMMEANYQGLIADYFSECESILSEVSVQLIYLSPPEITSHIDWVMNHRGIEWTGKVSGYLEATPYCSERGWKGSSCMRSFWSDYAALCDSLVLQSTMSSHSLKTGIEFFEYQFEEVIEEIGLNWITMP